MQANELEALYQQVEDELHQLHHSLQILRHALDEAVEENNRLRITNQDLRALANERVTRPTVDPHPPVDKPDHGAQRRLQSFYDEGIHICHQHFGERRDLDEGCLFCLGILGTLEPRSDER